MLVPLVYSCYYRPQTKLWEGNVFTLVCDSVHGVLCPGVFVWGSLSRGISVQEVSVQGFLSRRVSVQGGLCPWASLSSGGLCLGGLCPGGSLSNGGLCPGGLCLGWSLSRGFLSRGSLSMSLCQGVSVQ